MDKARDTQAGQSPGGPSVRRFANSIAGRLLAFTVAFVLGAEVLIFLPSISAYRSEWLAERVNAAQIAALAIEAAPEGEISESLRRELLQLAEVRLVALQREKERVLQLATEEAQAPIGSLRVADLRSEGGLQAVGEALAALVGRRDAVLRVIAEPRFESGEYVEVLLNEAPLTRDLRAYAAEVARTSFGISLLVGALVYGTLLLFFVRPLRRLTRHIERFRDRPYDAASLIRPSGRKDEIGRAEEALEAMGAQIRASLLQRERLAALGAAVAKIAHDLRGSLATASLVAERITESADPQVRQSAPRLERAIARAAGLAEAALKYGKAEEPTPELRALDLSEALEEAATEALAPFPGLAWRNTVPTGISVMADADQAHRLFGNLLRNAAQALSSQAGRGEPGVIAANATPLGEEVLIRIVDDGPGIPEAAQARLFQPFSASSKAGGTGLGLAIARELARAQGGDVTLLATGPEGTVFEVRLKSH